MKIKTIYFFILVCMFWTEAQAQKLPTLPSKSGLTAGIPKLPAKPEIPYLEELRQIQSLKRSYDSLRKEMRKIKEITADSTQRDSLFTLAKDRSKQVLEQESKTLESLIASDDIPGEEISNAAKSTLERVNESKARIADIKDVDELESLVDLNNENLKALTNEWLMPKVEAELTEVMKEGFDPTNVKLRDFYGKDALEELTKKGLPSEIPFEQAKELAKEKAGHISNEYIQKAGKDFSKLQIDSLGNIKTIPPELKNKKKAFFEPNELKGAPVVQRIGTMLWYDPLTSFGDGLLLDFGLAYSFSQQVSLLGGVTWKKLFDDEETLRREGIGGFTGLRLTKGNWFAQGTVNRNRVTISHPAGYESLDFAGKAWASSFALGRTIPMGKTIRSVVIGSIDPFFDKQTSLYKNRFQLKIGFEIGSFNKIKKEVKELIPADGLEEKGNEKVQYYLKDIGK
ncbi:hypothetical protein SAMN00777080_4404 [Aquiflexum balticum DSM 16537]|uniref:Uncharacterized protein n=1 Tax=Aquiflexum balticum DSM 16537 TaxID=758820 RepID=A0A1W2HA15_9BACT|nr:hypothetical protein [Aquiflexum balticum]SMD45740.1 hypothetical protein SAMN00777080_4404 [Aquiflexum balticum DSM 16537]